MKHIITVILLLGLAGCAQAKPTIQDSCPVAVIEVTPA